MAWNRAATVLMPNLGQLPINQRNTLRLVFLDPRARALYYDWEAVARTAVAAFRADVARAGAMAEVAALVEELSRSSSTFKAMWQDNDVSDSAHAGKGHTASGSWNNQLRMLYLRGGRTAGPYDGCLPTGSTEVAERIASLLGLRDKAG